MEKLLMGKSLVKAFGEGREKRNVLDDVTIEIGAGEFVSVMGPSGSGKSTLLFALGGMDVVDSGEVCFGGANLSSLSEDALADVRRTRMGFIFQQPTLLRNLNVLDNILLPALRDNRAGVRKLTEKARTLMKATGIEELEARDIAQVSGGQLQRVGICRALLHDPQILFGDEPTGALNSKAAQEIMDILAKINEGGTTVLLVTHDPRIAARTDRVLLMRDGKIIHALRLPRETDTEERVKLVVEETQRLGI